MLVVTTPSYSSFDVPRVISEVKKRDILSPTPNVKPKLAGDLLVKCGSELHWWPRRVIVRGGHLQVSPSRKDDVLPTLRLPLRHLSLQAGPLANSLSLSRGHVIVLTIQTTSEDFFDLWVKAIAIELIRQTPLDAVKYLDILNLTKVWKNKTNHHHDSPNADCPSSLPDNLPTKTSLSSLNESVDEVDFPFGVPNCDTKKCNIEEKTVETLLKKCQNSENYVPVKEKLVLFESLCKLGRKVRSTEDVSCRINVESKRARSMHDLSSFSSHIAVRDICKYFEKKCDDKVVGTSFGTMVVKKRLVCSDSHTLTVFKTFSN